MLAYVFGEAIEETLIDPYTIQGRYAQYQEPAASLEDVYGLANYPNPFTDQTVITARVNQSAYIRVYDLLGREIRRMALEPGNHTLKFSATELEPGLYGYSLYIQGKPVATKIMLHY